MAPIDNSPASLKEWLQDSSSSYAAATVALSDDPKYRYENMIDRLDID